MNLYNKRYNKRQKNRDQQTIKIILIKEIRLIDKQKMSMALNGISINYINK
jgi:hypothetical protein